MKRKIFWLLLIGLGVLGTLVCTPLSSQASTYSTELTFETSDQSMWGTGEAFVFDYTWEKKLPWDASVSIGGIADFGWGGKWGAEIYGQSDGYVGLQFTTHIDSGSVDVTYPVGIELSYPDPQSIQAGEEFFIESTLNIQPDADAVLLTDFPNLEVELNALYNIYASVGGSACAYGCVGGDVTLIDTGDRSFNLLRIDNDSIDSPLLTLAGVAGGVAKLTDTGDKEKDTKSDNADKDKDQRNQEGNTDSKKQKFKDWMGVVDVEAGIPDIYTVGGLTEDGNLASAGEDDFLDVTIDLDNVLTTLAGAPKLLGQSVNTAFGSIGYDILDVKAGIVAAVTQAFSFVPELKARLDFDQEVIANGETTRSVEFNVGDELALMLPEGTDTISATPTFWLDNDFTNDTGIRIDPVIRESLLSFDLFGLEASVYDGEQRFDVDANIPIFSNTFSLGGFSSFRTESFTLSSYHPPEITGPNSLSTNEDTPRRTFSQTVVDDYIEEKERDNYTLSVTATHGSLNLGSSTTGTLSTINGYLNGMTFTPASNFNGVARITLTVSDNMVLDDSEIAEPVTKTINITVKPVNDPPIITEDKPFSKTILEDKSFTRTLHASDVDGDTLTWTISSSPSHGTVRPASKTGNAYTYTYTPNPNYNGTDSFTIQVSDGHGGTDSMTVNVSIAPVNDAPSFQLQNAMIMVDINQAFNKPWITNIVAGPANESGQTLTFTVNNNNTPLFSVQPAIAISSGRLSFTPALDATGSTMVTATLTDSEGGQATQAFVITVAMRIATRSPARNALSAAADSDIVVTYPAAIDPNTVTGRTFIVAGSLSGPHTGTLTVKDDATIAFNPNDDFAVGETVTITLTNGIEDASGSSVTPETWQFAIAAPNGDASFYNSGQRLGNTGSWSVALGDVDGDGDFDAIFTNWEGANRVWRNDGAGIFTSGQGMGNADSKDVALGDVDGDGDLDAVVMSYSGANRVWRNDGTGTFTSGQGLGSASWGVTLGDVDGDGDLDAVVMNSVPGGADRVWRNDGAGIFTSGQALGNADSRSVALGDMDGDGDLDALSAIWGANKVWLNDGTGIFTSGQGLGNADSWSVALGDVDGDGDLDAIFANREGADRVWLNDGTGTFTDSGQALGNTFTQGVVLGDVDGDGDLDAIFANREGADRVWLNDGTGIFTSGQALGNADSRSVALGDVDGDGDLDALFAIWGANKVWLNNTIPVAGFGTALEFDGTDDYVSIGNPETLNVEGQITIEAWIRPTATDGLRNIVAHGHSTAPTREVYLRILNGKYQVGQVGASPSFTEAAIPPEDVNHWVHLAGLYNGTAWKLYRNGIEISSTTSASGAVTVNADWAIGSRGTGTERFFQGQIDEVRIWNKARTPEHIQATMYTRLTGTEAGLVGYWPFDEVSGTTAYDKTSQHHGTLRNMGNAAWVASGVESQYILPKSAALSGTLPAYDGDSDPLTYSLVTGVSNGTLDLDAGTGAFTYTPNPNALGTDTFSFKVNDGHTDSNTAEMSVKIINRPPVAGFGPALAFDGADDYVGLGNPETLNIGGQITIEAWIRPTAIDRPLNNIVAHGYSPAPIRAVYLRIHNGKYQVGSYRDGYGTLTAAEIPPEDVNHWVHLAGLYDGTAWKLYRNGIEISSTTNARGAVTVNEDWAIGSRGTGTGRFFQGQIDEVRIWNKARTPEDIQATLYTRLSGAEPGLVGYWAFDEGTGMTASDTTLSQHHGTLYNMDDAHWVIPVVTTDEDTPVNGILSDMMPVGDPDNDALTYSLDTDGSNGTVTLDENTGEFTYTPNHYETGIDSFIFKVNDGTTDSNLAQVHVYVIPEHCVSVASGSWSSQTTWAGACHGPAGIPDETDLVVIRAGHLVNLDGDYGVKDLALEAGGELIFEDNTTLSIADGGTLTNDGTFTAGNGSVSFAGSGSVVSATPMTFYTVELGGAVNLGENATIGHVLWLHSGGSLTTYAPLYGENSTLRYEAGSYVPGNEWLAGISPGAGVPHHVHISSGASLDLSVSGEARAATGDMTIDNGSSLVLSTIDGADLYVGGDWNNAGGTFTPNGRAVILNGMGQTIHGSTLFSDLTKTVTSADTLTFEAGTTQTIEGMLMLEGKAGTLLALHSDTNGSQWKIDPQGGRHIQYMDVQDSHNLNTVAIDAWGSVDSGNNLNWNFNRVPVAVNDTATTDEDLPVTIAVLANDSDADGDPLTVGEITQGSSGTVSTNGTDVTYTPNADFYGIDTFTYTANDGATDSMAATVQITVNAINDAPVILEGEAITMTGSEDNSPSPFGSLTLHATDADGDTLAWNISEFADHGSIELSGTLNTYTPDPNYNGPDSFEVQVSDGHGGTDTIVVNVTIEPVNDAPVAVDDTTTIFEDLEITIDVLANDRDIDGDQLTIGSVTQGSYGTVSINGAEITYTLTNPDFYGPDTFTYTTNDGTTDSNEATVTIEVLQLITQAVTPDESMRILLPDNAGWIDFPAGALPDGASVKIVPVEDLFIPLPGEEFQLLGAGYLCVVSDSKGEQITNSDSDLTLTLRYDPTDLEDLTIYSFDQTGWASIGSTVNTLDYTITGSTKHISMWTILGRSPEPGPEEPIPEPTTFVLFGLGLIGLLALARRRHRRK